MDLLSGRGHRSTDARGRFRSWCEQLVAPEQVDPISELPEAKKRGREPPQLQKLAVPTTTMPSPPVVTGGPDSGRLRWAVNSEEWQPPGGADGPEFRFLLSLIPEAAERETVCRYVFLEDKKRALISRLLSRRACAAVLGLRSFANIKIARTKGRKPFLKSPRPPADKPHLANFNFNVSHEGSWVVLASEPICVCGVDVAAPCAARPGADNIDPWRDFQDQLAVDEWAVVFEAADQEETVAEEPQVLLDPLLNGSDQRPSSPPGYGMFQRFWSAKEAFVKARGDGLGFELKRACFRFEPFTGRSTSAGSFASLPSTGSCLSCLSLQSRLCCSCSSSSPASTGLRSLSPASRPDTAPIPASAGHVAYVRVDGAPANDWRFFQHMLGKDHWVTVARGPTYNVVDEIGEFASTLVRKTEKFSAEQWQAELDKESPAFEELAVAALVPEDSMQEYLNLLAKPVL